MITPIIEQLTLFFVFILILHIFLKDFAGAGVVHLCGGTISFVAAWMIGPRAGRFSSNGRANRIEGHSVPVSHF